MTTFRHFFFISSSLTFPKPLLPTSTSLILCLAAATVAAALQAPLFSDVSLALGLKRPYGPRIKYGGACVADVDGDGWVDLLMGHHDRRYADLYYGNANGSFTRAAWDMWVDAHGFNAAKLSPFNRGMHFVVSRGGNRGKFPNLPLLYSIDPDSRAVNKVPIYANFTRGRGRSAVFMHVGRKTKGARRPLLVLLNLPVKSGDRAHVVVRPIWTKGRGYILRRVPILSGGGFPTNGNAYGMAIDVDGDGVMELLTWHRLKIYKMAWSSSRVGHLIITDITDRVMPEHLHNIGAVSGVSEFDYDNDGAMDLYLSRTSRGELKWTQRLRPAIDTSDILLRNVGGKYEDVSQSVGIPRNTWSQGVTAGDFNNDGFVDLFVSQYSARHILLLNRGDGTFALSRPLRTTSAAGDQATAVDYDNDGRVDLVVSEGEWFDKSKGGFYHILRNVTPHGPKGKRRNWIGVWVRESLGKRSTALHATVTVCVGAGKKQWCQIKRCGSPGTAVSNSNIDSLRFGVGGYGKVSRVTVRWQSGQSLTRWGLGVNRIISVGV